MNYNKSSSFLMSHKVTGPSNFYTRKLIRDLWKTKINIWKKVSKKLSGPRKNRIKAKFRQNGIRCTGATVYAKAYREEWKERLPQETTLRLIVDGLWRQLDQFERTAKEILVAARDQSKQYHEIKYFKAIPGIGFINAATISAILETPHRFATKRKVWMYAGLGLIRKSSGGKVYSEKLTKNYNHLLKYTTKQAAEVAIRATDNPFRQKFLNMTLIHGIAPHRAKLTIARDILATMWAMWRKGEKYNPQIRKAAICRQG